MPIISKPYLSLFVKAVLDAYNKIVWTDDRQIIEVNAFKHNSNKPRVEFDFEPALLKNFNAGADSVAFLLKSIASAAGVPPDLLLTYLTDFLKDSKFVKFFGDDAAAANKHFDKLTAKLGAEAINFDAEI
ncbi:MAG: RusA family crossover junction endodeoxyribonuclease [Selenomonadaceae bacterium]|nr:RusA family crossover junction endodeoxyribonuclease [Selenomonadaceae bacterium]